MNDDLDELASAYLDGEATDDEVLRVESDPDLLDRVELLMRARLGSLPVVQPDPEVRRRHLAIAMDAYDRGVRDSATEGEAVRGGHLRAIGTPPRRERAEPLRPVEDRDDDESGVSTGPGAGGVPSVVDRSERRSRGALRTRWLGAAAAGLLVIAAIGVSLGRGDGNDAGLDTAMEEQADDAGETTAMAVPEEAASDAAGSTEADADEAMAASASRTVGSLFLDPRPDAAEALLAAIDGGLVPDPEAGAADEPVAGVGPAEDPFGCAEVLAIDRTLVGVVLIESADGRSYLYVLGGDASAPEGSAVLVDEACRLLSTTP